MRRARDVSASSDGQQVSGRPYGHAEHLHSLAEQAEQQNIPAAELLDPLLMPMDSPASDYPIVNLPLTSSVYFKNGNPVRTSGVPLEGLVRVTEGDDGKFIGMGRSTMKVVSPLVDWWLSILHSALCLAIRRRCE